eukprot:902631_1
MVTSFLAIRNFNMNPWIFEPQTSTNMHTNDSLVSTKNKPKLIFQIGFNKCGTTTLFQFFLLNSIPSMHFNWRPKSDSQFRGTLSQNMFDQYLQNKPLLERFINDTVFYADFGVYIQPNQDDDILFLNESYQIGAYRTWYKILNEQYPEYEKLFILNIRNVNNWLRSRYRNYYKGYLVDTARNAVNHTFHQQIDDIAVMYRWKALWYTYICNLLTYFKRNNLADQLIMFDIEHDSPLKLVDWFVKHNVSLNATLYSLGNNSKDKKDQLRRGQWNAIVKTHPDLASDTHDPYNNEYERIYYKCDSQ